MDRRQALKKMGFGTGVAIGASAVASSPVSAATGSPGGSDPQVVSGPSVTVFLPGSDPRAPIWAGYSFLVEVVAGSASCPDPTGVVSVEEISATPTRVVCQPVAGFDCGMWLDEWRLQQLTRVIPPDSGIIESPIPLTVSSTTGSLTFDLTKGTIPQQGLVSAPQYATGDEFSVEVSTTFRCTAPGGAFTETTDVVDINFRRNEVGTWPEV